MSTRQPSRTASIRCISKQHFHRIIYREWGDPESNRVALCVHGLSRQGRDFDFLAAELAACGYRVVCPDLAGRGESGWLADPDEYTLPQYCMDMAVLLARLNVEHVDWIGTSLGGLIGMVMAGMTNNPVRRLVINDIGPSVPWSALRRLGDYLTNAPADFPDMPSAERYFREILAPYGELSDEQWVHLTRYSVVETPERRFRLRHDRRIAEAFRPGRISSLTPWTYWDAITCPVLLLRGETSDFLPKDMAAEMTGRGPHAQLIEIAGCGHVPALMSKDQIDLVVNWLRSSNGRLTPSAKR